jgi:hypothetical protein
MTQGTMRSDAGWAGILAAAISIAATGIASAQQSETAPAQPTGAHQPRTIGVGLDYRY